jgi:hypothetical protein
LIRRLAKAIESPRKEVELPPLDDECVYRNELYWGVLVPMHLEDEDAEKWLGVIREDAEMLDRAERQIMHYRLHREEELDTLNTRLKVLHGERPPTDWMPYLYLNSWDSARKNRWRVFSRWVEYEHSKVLDERKPVLMGAELKVEAIRVGKWPETPQASDSHQSVG